MHYRDSGLFVSLMAALSRACFDPCQKFRRHKGASRLAARGWDLTQIKAAPQPKRLIRLGFRALGSLARRDRNAEQRLGERRDAISNCRYT